MRPAVYIVHLLAAALFLPLQASNLSTMSTAVSSEACYWENLALVQMKAQLINKTGVADIEQRMLARNTALHGSSKSAKTAFAKRDVCDKQALKRTHSLIHERRWNDLTLSPCIDPYFVEGILDGSEDPADLWEALYKPTVGEDQCSQFLLPKVLFIGLNHAGSCTIAGMMNAHPEMSFGIWKEHEFFASTAGSFFKSTPLKPFKPLQNRTLEDYKYEFEVPCDVKFTFDASPNYWAMGKPDLPFHPTFRQQPGLGAVQEVRSLLGSDIKIIWVAKDPLKWLASNLLFDANRTSQRPKGFQLISCMANGIETWLQVFPREQFLFLDSDHAFSNLTRLFDEINAFVGVTQIPLRSLGIPETYSDGRRRTTRTVTPRDREEFLSYDHLNTHFDEKECMLRLENLTGLSLDWQIDLDVQR